VHWLDSFVAGTLTMRINASGTTLAFRDKLLDLFSPALCNVPLLPAFFLAPDWLRRAARETDPFA
jgi:hypothetical protein